MLSIDHMKRQHAEIDAAMADAMRAIDGELPASDMGSVATLLSEISSMIDDHLRTEDGEVYEALIKYDDPEIKRAATQFHKNLGGLAEEFASYFKRYGSQAAIDANPGLFSYETRRLFERMRYRMQREETDLYPLLER